MPSDDCLFCNRIDEAEKEMLVARHETNDIVGSISDIKIRTRLECALVRERAAMLYWSGMKSIAYVLKAHVNRVDSQ